MIRQTSVLSRRARAALAALAALLAVIGAPSEVRADLVPPAPTSCPAKTHPKTGHFGTGCAPDDCPLGAEGRICEHDRGCCEVPLCGEQPGDPVCPRGKACVEVRLCVVPGTWGRSWEVTGYCSEMTGCPAGSTCEIVPTCITSSTTSATAPGRRRAACSCDLAAEDGSFSLALGSFAFVVALAARRSARRRFARQC